MESITKVKTANHEEWLKLRSQYIGGSDAAAVVGLNAHASQFSLWAEKTGRVPGFSGNLATEVGTFLEEFVAQKFAQETGKKVRKCNHSFFNSKYPWAIANIDREIVGSDEGLEIKTTDSLNMKKFKNGEYPAHYYCQCVHYLAVTGKKRWHLAVLIGNKDFKTFTIERDEAEIEALMRAEKDFWECVKNNTPPLIDGTEASSEAVQTIYADCNDFTADISAFDEDLARREQLKAQIKELEQEAEEIANRLKIFLGEIGGGNSDRFKVSWKPQSRTTFDHRRFATDNPDVDLSEYFKSSTTRTFRVTEINN